MIEMESTLYNKQRVLIILKQIETAINQLKDWNKGVTSSDDYYLSSNGVQKLAASCMLIEAIGESVNQIDKITKGEMLPERSEIPWSDVIGIRNHIAHGYFDIDADIVLQVIREDLDPLSEAIHYFIRSLSE
ncbi:MAG: DUF86 domain-containing protein [Bacteroidaceae bacterium]|nr:DUF86 domain-containing protein [Bacteroidaceae bacterium]